ncbi:MAG: hypothetical protein KBA53_00520 [Thermoclostridium sp.]|nr:hypothetical protein [Thermoclostridium sp.]
MRKSKSAICITATLTILLAVFLVSSIYKVALWGGVLSPLIAFFSAGILILPYIRSQRIKTIITQSNINPECLMQK